MYLETFKNHRRKFFNHKKEVSIKAKEAWKTENSNRKTNTKQKSCPLHIVNKTLTVQRKEKKYFKLQG